MNTKHRGYFLPKKGNFKRPHIIYYSKQNITDWLIIRGVTGADADSDHIMVRATL